MAAELVSGANDTNKKTMQIFVVLPRPGSHLNPNTISLEVSSSDTVASIKAMLEDIDGIQNLIARLEGTDGTNQNLIAELKAIDATHKGRFWFEGVVGTPCLDPIPPRRQRLVLAGSALPDEDGRTLADLGVTDSSTLQLVQTGMTVYVRDTCFVGAIHGLHGLSSTDTVDTLKARYEAAKGMPAERQRLKYNTREMRNGTTLADCGVQDMHTLYVDRMRWEHTGLARSRVLAVKVYGFDTVRRLKEIVEAAEGLPVAAQRVYRNGGPATGYKHEDLEDHRTMKELGVMTYPDEPALYDYHPGVSLEYRLEAAPAAGEGEERAHVPRVLFRGTHQQHNARALRKIMRQRAGKEKPYSRPPLPPISRRLNVFISARDPQLP